MVTKSLVQQEITAGHVYKSDGPSIGCILTYLSRGWIILIVRFNLFSRFAIEGNAIDDEIKARIVKLKC